MSQPHREYWQGPKIAKLAFAEETLDGLNFTFIWTNVSTLLASISKDMDILFEFYLFPDHYHWNETKKSQNY